MDKGALLLLLIQTQKSLLFDERSVLQRGKSFASLNEKFNNSTCEGFDRIGRTKICFKRVHFWHRQT